MQYDTSSITLTNLSYGMHTFIIELVDTNHLSFVPAIADTLYFEILANISGCTDSLAFNYNAQATNDDGSCFFVNPSNHIINTVGMFFDPDTLYVTVGDTVTFNIGNFHNAVEIDSATYTSNGTNSNGGFSFGVGAFDWVVPQAQTYYYICQPHALMGMKGMIVANMPLNPVMGCMDSTASNFDYLANTDDGSCIYLTYVPDDNFENWLENNGYGDDIPSNDYVFTNRIDTIDFLFVGFEGIQDLTGIEDFTMLKDLRCFGWNNVLSNIDVSQNLLLEQLMIGEHMISGTLDLSNNHNLQYINVSAKTVWKNPQTPTIDTILLGCYCHSLIKYARYKLEL